MTQLKTLKDIEFEPYTWNESKFDLNSKENIQDKITKNNKELLKQEAIKWIKELEKCYRPEDYDFPKEYDDFVSSDEFGSSAGNVIRWIKHFFNISDEELK